MSGFRDAPSAYRTAFASRHVVLPVIHVASAEQALRNAYLARQAGANGVFLINHNQPWTELLEIHRAVANEHRDWWVGVNCLGMYAAGVFPEIDATVAGVWADSAQIDERSEDQPAAEATQQARLAANWTGVYFGGVAFKYQRPVEDLEAAARRAMPYVDVVTTSGAGTGLAAHVDKIRTMKAALGDFPLAIASGVTPENVGDYLDCADCFLVATGVSQSFHEFDLMRLLNLIGAVRQG